MSTASGLWVALAPRIAVLPPPPSFSFCSSLLAPLPWTSPRRPCLWRCGGMLLTRREFPTWPNVAADGIGAGALTPLQGFLKGQLTGNGHGGYQALGGLTGTCLAPQVTSPKYIEQDAKQGPLSQFAGREWAVSCAPAAKSCMGRVCVRRCACRHSLSFSVLGFSQSCLPHAARRGAACRSVIQVLSKRAYVTLLHSPFSLLCQTL